MTYNLPDEIELYWLTFVDESYLGNVTARELRECKRGLFYVELSVVMMQTLGCLKEPLELLPLLINWTAVDYGSYAHLAEPDLLKRNALRLQALRSTHAWGEALSAYLIYPAEIRLFNSPGLDPAGLSRQELQSLTFERFIQSGPDSRREYLEHVLREPLRHATQAFSFPQHPGPHFAWCDGQQLQFELTESDIDNVDRLMTGFPLMPTHRLHQPRDVHIRIPEDLEGVAQRLGGPWPALLASVNLRKVGPNGLQPSNSLPLILDDHNPFEHAIGMTGARKSVLATLIAGWAIEQTLETGEMHRVGIKNATIAESLRRADLLNNTYCSRITDRPVAVPIFGESGRHRQMVQFFESAEFDPNRTHWGERFLASSCALQSRLTIASREALAGQSLPAGSEPCTRLKDPARPSMTYTCPFFARCPTQQRFADLAAAPVWLMNPWTFAYSRLPLPLLRPTPESHAGHSLRIMELVAGHADLVIVDEADVMQTTRDQVWGPTFRLYGGQAGLYDANIAAIIHHDQRHRVESAGHPWVRSFVSAWEAVNVVSAILMDAQHGSALAKWISRDFFTLEYLIQRLAHKLCGMPRTTYLSVDDQQLLEDRFGALTSQYLDILRVIMGGTPVPDNESDLDEAHRELLQIRRAMVTTTSHRHHQVRYRVREWLRQWVLDPQGDYPGYERRVADISHLLGWPHYLPESRERLEALLLFALALSNLRYYTQLVLARWESRPPIEQFSTEPMARAPYYADGLLPAPPLGQMFGFRVQRNDVFEDDDGIIIETAEHRAIGRGALFNLPELREPAEGVKGPRVLTLSATSYMPGSEKFHQPIPPGSVLEPTPPRAPAEASDHPVAQSTLSFRPILDNDGEPITVSGRPDKEERLRLMARQMSAQLLPDILETIAYRTAQAPQSWYDRERIVILPNSYDQAKAMAAPLANSRLFDRVVLLARDVATMVHGVETILLGDVERIGLREGERMVLVAPVGAIGRGLNILNAQGIAAFGGAVFATRYYPPPGEFARIVTAMHAATYHGQDKLDGSAYENLRRLRQRLRRVKAAAERDKPYSRLTASERRTLAADTTVLIAQAAGRLVRGIPDMVPFLAVFADAAWAPESAKGECDTPVTSLLVAMQDYMRALVEADPVFRAAHGPLYYAIERIQGVCRA